eukprot:2078855-Rhodomonas_salina.1
MPLTAPSASSLKRKRDDKTGEVVNFAKCVDMLQFNSGARWPYATPKARLCVNAEKCVTLVLEEEMKGVLIFGFASQYMHKHMVSMSDLHLELKQAGGENKPVELLKVQWCGFMTPEIKLCFGDEDVFSLSYTNALGSVELLEVTLACRRKEAVVDTVRESA